MIKLMVLFLCHQACGGDYRGSVENNYDHIKMVGAYGGKKALKEISKFYLEIVKELKEKGF